MEEKQYNKKKKLGIRTEKGVYFDILITDSDHQRVESQDGDVLVTDSVVTKYLKFVKNFPYSDDNVQSLKLKGWGLPAFVPYILNEEGKLAPVKGIKGENKSTDIKECSPWDQDNTFALISLVTESKANFASPLMKNRKVWNLISNELQAMGFAFSRDACNNKWRHLKARFNEITRSGKKNIGWVYYKKMEQALDMRSFLENETTQSTFSVKENQTLSVGSVWDQEKTCNFISLVTENRVNLASPLVKKQKVWNLISNKMQAAGVKVSWEACSRKWRRLQSRLKEIAKDESKISTWPVYDQMKKAVETWPSLPTVQDNKLIGGMPLPCENSQKCLKENTHWNKTSSLAFISLVIEKSADLANPSICKKKVWNMIAEDLQTMDHNFSGVACYKKWRLLKWRFNQITVYGLKVKWQYFEAMKHAMKVLTSLKIKRQVKNVDLKASEPPHDVTDETLNAQEEVSGESKHSEKLFKSSKSKRSKIPINIPLKHLGFAQMFRKGERKTRILMKTLVREKQRSASLFEQFLAGVDTVSHSEIKKKDNKDH